MRLKWAYWICTGASSFKNWKRLGWLKLPTDVGRHSASCVAFKSYNNRRSRNGAAKIFYHYDPSDD